jgi:hypothetical protein
MARDRICVVPAAMADYRGSIAGMSNDAGISAGGGGAVIQGANSVDTGVKVGVIVFCAIGIAVPVVIRLRRTRKLAA